MTRPLPYDLPEHDKKTLWKTKTSPESDKQNAYNELRFDDRKDKELVYLQAQLDYQQLVKRNETERTGNNRVMVVGRHRAAIVAEIDAHLVGKKYSVQVVEEPDEGKTEVEDKKETGHLGADGARAEADRHQARDDRRSHSHHRGEGQHV